MPSSLKTPTIVAPRSARWLLFYVGFVRDLLNWQAPGALSPDLEDLP